MIKSTQSSVKQTVWKAHDGVVLKVSCTLSLPLSMLLVVVPYFCI